MSCPFCPGCMEDLFFHLNSPPPQKQDFCCKGGPHSRVVWGSGHFVLELVVKWTFFANFWGQFAAPLCHKLDC